MGDKNRGIVFANYIRRNVRDCKTILAVADGNITLSRHLYTDYEVTVVDPNIRNCNKEYRKAMCIIGRTFTSQWRITKYDLIVGMHPDEATGEIIDYCVRTKIPALIVPCCLKGKYSKQCQNKHRWVKFIKNIFVQNGRVVNIDMLRITGDNLCINAKPNYRRQI
jgi:hypothetical protein